MQQLYFNKQSQQGIALLAVLLIISIFTILGMMNVKKARESERLSGSNVRYNTVFEAAEQTLRDAGDYLLRINGTPYVGNGSLGRNTAKNFDITKIDSPKLVSDPSAAIIWSRDTLAKKVCGSGKCIAGVDFINRVDDDLWQNLAIQSVSDNSSCSTTSATAKVNTVACNNYMRDIQTYTFIEKLRSADGNAGGKNNQTAMQGTSGLGTPGSETYYLITVKASGYPPGMDEADKKSINSRENIVLQGVFSRL